MRSGARPHCFAASASSSALALAAVVAACGGDENGRDAPSGSGDNGGRPNIAGLGGRVSSGGSASGAQGGTGPSGGAMAGEQGGMPQAGAGASGSSGAAAGANEGSGFTVEGRVVDYETRRPLGKRRIIVGSSLTHENAAVTESSDDGFFTFERNGNYRVLIVDPDGSTISLYEELDVAKPVLLHRSSDAVKPPVSFGTLRGSVSGGASYPLAGSGAIVSIRLFTPQRSGAVFLSGSDPPHGPEYELFFGFDGEAVVATLMALGTFPNPAIEDSYTAVAAVRTLPLGIGETRQDLALAPVPLQRVSGQVTVPNGWELVQTQEYARMLMPDATIPFPLAPITRTSPFLNGGAFEYEVPDLAELGATLCLAAVAVDEHDRMLWSERCNVTAGEEVSLEFLGVPVLTEPVGGASFGSGTTFSWSGAGDTRSPNVVELRPARATVTTPLITIFTTGDTATLPDLAEWDIELAVGGAYRARAVAFAADAEAFGPDGLGAAVPAGWRRSYSSEVSLNVEE